MTSLKRRNIISLAFTSLNNNNNNINNNNNNNNNNIRNFVKIPLVNSVVKRYILLTFSLSSEPISTISAWYFCRLQADCSSRSPLTRELKHQTFSTGRRRPEVKFTSDPRFPPTWSAVATRRRLCFAYFDVACKT